ncbi:Hypothetical protein CINCED_3A006319 [Cinara cedri]|uniref:Uncharacterized protein n=1 Tax=Cinara cedri TaxID=506608 RepID=A0A5E4M0P6_9HEMI|nr:Hypothetical protein CINCED_3A006319 [Cinara cedri]
MIRVAIEYDSKTIKSVFAVDGRSYGLPNAENIFRAKRINVVDLFLISLFYALIGQYKVIAESFRSIGLEEKIQKGKTFLRKLYVKEIFVKP